MLSQLLVCDAPPRRLSLGVGRAMAPRFLLLQTFCEIGPFRADSPLSLRCPKIIGVLFFDNPFFGSHPPLSSLTLFPAKFMRRFFLRSPSFYFGADPSSTIRIFLSLLYRSLPPLFVPPIIAQCISLWKGFSPIPWDLFAIGLSIVFQYVNARLSYSTAPLIAYRLDLPLNSPFCPSSPYYHMASYPPEFSSFPCAAALSESRALLIFLPSRPLLQEVIVESKRLCRSAFSSNVFLSLSSSPVWSSSYGAA